MARIPCHSLLGRTMRFPVCALIIGVLAFLPASRVLAGTLEDVQERGHLICGANGQSPGFSLEEADGRWTGFDVDICRAIAAAVLSDADKAVFVPVFGRDRFLVLRAGELDVLTSSPTWTLVRDNAYALNFAGVVLYDG